MERNSFGGRFVLFWRKISTSRMTSLHNVVGNSTGNRYWDDILKSLVGQTLQQIDPNAVLHDEDARPHRAVNAFNRVNRVMTVTSEQSRSETNRLYMGRDRTSDSTISSSLCWSGSAVAIALARVECRATSRPLQHGLLYKKTLPWMPHRQWGSHASGV